MTQRALTIVDAARSGSELPTAQRLAKSASARVIEDREGNRKVILGDDSALGKLARLGKITIREYEAGLLFAADFYIVHGSGGPRAQSFEPPVSGGGDTPDGTAKIAAKQRLEGDRDRMGPQLFACLIGVCGLGESPQAWARSAGLHNTVGSHLIGIALDRLAFSRRLPLNY